eukprot:TRINITY_DN2206_c0_g2_i3.p1 TRINITY_DN2206_c0_g2~~TRINITY_DN2206_c0_g2_i3.p1  ORF type:complete len:551 (+),score=117.72 TRINITY_DN2206_c0_g2_i3:493-2145(+)
MDISLRKRNASDGDSGFDSALSSRSSSICLEDSPELTDFKISKVEEDSHSPPEPDLNNKFARILDKNEKIYKDEGTDGLYIIRNADTGRETVYKPPGRLRFKDHAGDGDSLLSVGETYARSEYTRATPVSRSHIFNSRLQLELEKQVAKMQLLEIDLLMDKSQVPPPSLGIRVIGVNMIHGVPDKLNIYVKKVMPDSVAGRDGRIQIDDHIVEVNGVSLVGVSQKLAAETLSSCMVNPHTGFVNFVLARPPKPSEDEASSTVVSQQNQEQSTSTLLEQQKEPSSPTIIAPKKADTSLVDTSGASLDTSQNTRSLDTDCGAESKAEISKVILSSSPPPRETAISGTSEAFIPSISSSPLASEAPTEDSKALVTSSEAPTEASEALITSSEAPVISTSEAPPGLASDDLCPPSLRNPEAPSFMEPEKNLSDKPSNVLQHVEKSAVSPPRPRTTTEDYVNKSFANHKNNANNEDVSCIEKADVTSTTEKIAEPMLATFRHAKLITTESLNNNNNNEEAVGNNKELPKNAESAIHRRNMLDVARLQQKPIVPCI